MREVLISHGFGAGWSTWICHHNDKAEQEMALFDEDLITAIKAYNSEEDVLQAINDFAKRFQARFGHKPYLGGAKNLSVETVNGPFIVEEYDGAESILLRDETEWIE